MLSGLSEPVGALLTLFFFRVSLLPASPHHHHHHTRAHTQQLACCSKVNITQCEALTCGYGVRFYNDDDAMRRAAMRTCAQCDNLTWIAGCQDVITQERIDYALAFVGGVMMAVALAELLPEAKRLNQPGMTALGLHPDPRTPLSLALRARLSFFL
eukprot:2266514-Rhodomonas_salina.1